MRKLVLIVLGLYAISNLHAQTQYTLEAYTEMALKNNVLVKEAKRQLEVADLDTKIARSQRKPTLNGLGNAYAFINPPSDLLPSYSSNAGINATQVLYAGGRINKSIQASEIGKTIVENQVHLSENEVVFRTSELYWTILKIKEQIEVSESQLNALTQLEKELNDVVEVGLAQKNDLLKVQVEKNNVSLKMDILKDQLVTTTYSLQQFVGMEMTGEIALADSVIQVGLVTSDYSAAVEQALKSRPEISMLRNQVELVRKQGEIADAAYGPQIGIGISSLGILSEEISFNESLGGAIINDGTSFITIPSVNVTIPIFHAGRRKLQNQKYEQQTIIQQDRFKDVQEKISIEVREAIFAWNQAYKAVKVGELSLEQATENLRLLRDQFETGLVNGSDMLEAQSLWEESLSKVISAKADYKIKEAMVQKVIAVY